MIVRHTATPFKKLLLRKMPAGIFHQPDCVCRDTININGIHICTIVIKCRFLIGNLNKCPTGTRFCQFLPGAAVLTDFNCIITQLRPVRCQLCIVKTAQIIGQDTRIISIVQLVNIQIRTAGFVIVLT